MKKSAAVLLTTLSVLTCSSISSAQSFRYIDESGNIFWVDSINEIPPRYRTQVLGEPTIDPEMLDKRGNLKKNYRPKEPKPTKAPKPTRVPKQPNIPRSRFQKDPVPAGVQKQPPVGFNPYGAPQPGVQMPPAFPQPGLPGMIPQQQINPNGYPVEPQLQQMPAQQAAEPPQLPPGMGGELARHEKPEVEVRPE